MFMSTVPTGDLSDLVWSVDGELVVRDDERSDEGRQAHGSDRIVEPSVDNSTASADRMSSAMPEARRRSHLATGEDGWAKVAGYTLTWGVGHAR
jgi:hypothetical protein